MTGDEIVFEVAKKTYQGNSISAADKLLGDFRKGFMGYGSLESPLQAPKWPISPSDRQSIDFQQHKVVKKGTFSDGLELGVKVGEFDDDEVDVEVDVSEEDDDVGSDSLNEEVVVEQPRRFDSNVGRGKYEGW